MPIKGLLSKMATPELLQLLAKDRQTGTLCVTNGEIETKIYLQDGEIVSSSSTDPKGFLGQFLISKGVITEEVLALAMAVQEEFGGLLGEILIDGDALDRETLDHMLRIKAEENIYELFAWQEGGFEFIEGELPEHEMVRISATMSNLILEGARRVDRASAFKEVIPSTQCVPVSVGPLIDEDEMDMGWRGVLEAVDDDRSIEDICLHTHSSEFFVCQVLYEKISEGLLKIVRPRVVAAESKLPQPALNVVDPPESEKPPEDDGPPASPEALIAEANSLLKTGAYVSSVRYLRAATSLDPHNRELSLVVKELEAEVVAGIERDGASPKAVPVLASPLEDLRAMSFSPDEGFILSRVNGVSDIGSIVKTSPLPKLDSLLVFWNLVQAKHILLRKPRRTAE
jgi:hypothetical protein